MDRKTFVKTSSVATLGTVLGAPSILKANKTKNNTVRIGFIGTGLRGRNHVNNLLATEGVECPVICDIDPSAVEQTLAMFEEREKPKPKVYSENEWSFKEMLDKEDLDGVIISTYWKWHTAMSIAAMEAGVVVGVEVSGAFSIDECWNLVDAHERTGTHLMFMENVCYRRDVMAVLNMVRDNQFGELVHFRGGYQHDLRTVKFNDGEGGLIYGEGSYGEARWRTAHSEHRLSLIHISEPTRPY